MHSFRACAFTIEHEGERMEIPVFAGMAGGVRVPFGTRSDGEPKTGFPPSRE